MRKRKLTTEELMQAVNQYLINESGLEEIARRYGINQAVIRGAAALYTAKGATALFGHHHIQYTHRAFHHMLTKAGMIQSMSRVAKCIDNGPMEGCWGILKRERYYGTRFTDRASLVTMIEDFIRYYNTERLQRNLGVLTPMEKHELYSAA